MVLVDTSIWIRLEHQRDTLPRLLPDDERDVAACPIVVMEFLRGVQNEKRYRLGREMFMFAHMLDAPTPLERFEEAAQLYLQCRKEGITASSADCLIAACAIAHDVPLLHDDADFEHIARLTALRTVTRS